MSNFGTGISPWVNGIPPCFVSQPTYVPPTVGFQNWGQSGGMADARVDSGQMFSSSMSGDSYQRNKRALQYGSPSGIAKKFRAEQQQMHLKVTIPGEGRVGRTVNNSGRGGVEFYQRKKRQVSHVCLVCNKYFSVAASYQHHLTSPGHMMKLQVKAKVAAAIKVKSLMHMKTFDPTKTIGSNAAQPSSSHQLKGVDRNQLSQATPKRLNFCWQCKINFSCTVIEHRQTEGHKNAKSMDRPFCAECEMFFSTPQKFVQHCKDKKHSSWRTSASPAPPAASSANKHDRRGRPWSRKAIDEEDDVRRGDFVTVDAVGYDDDEEEDEQRIEDLSVVDEAYGDDNDDYVTADDTTLPPENSNQGEDGTDDTPEKQSRPSVAASEAKTAAATPRKLSKQSMMTEPKVAAAAASSLPLKKSGPNADRVTDVAELPKADLAKPTVGVNLIVPISGFYCKICHKLFMDEAIAKINHCQSEGHYSRYMALQAAMLHKAPIKSEPTTERKTETNQKLNTTANKAPAKEREGCINEATIVSKAADKEATKASSDESTAGVVDSANENAAAAAKDNADSSAAEKCVANESIATEEDPSKVSLPVSKDASTDNAFDKRDASTEGMTDEKNASTEGMADKKDASIEGMADEADASTEDVGATKDSTNESAHTEKDKIGDLRQPTTKDISNESMTTEKDLTKETNVEIEKANTDG